MWAEEQAFLASHRVHANERVAYRGQGVVRADVLAACLACGEVQDVVMIVDHPSAFGLGPEFVVERIVRGVQVGE